MEAVLAVDYLRRVRGRIGRPEQWVRASTMAKTADGGNCQPTDKRAVAWSLPAAMERERYAEQRGLLGRRKLALALPEQAYLMGYTTVGFQAFDRLDEIERATATIGGDPFAPRKSVTPMAICEYAIFQYTTADIKADYARVIWSTRR